MRFVSLTQGQFFLVDDDDFERVSKLKWFAYKSGSYARFFYAARAYDASALKHFGSFARTNQQIGVL